MGNNKRLNHNLSNKSTKFINTILTHERKILTLKYYFCDKKDDMKMNYNVWSERKIYKLIIVCLN